mgnify:FL=1
MPEGKRPDSRRRAPASRPGGPRADRPHAKRDRPGAAAPRREPRAIEPHPDPGHDGGAGASIRRFIAERAERLAAQQSEQRFGSVALRAAILAAVVCVLTLTIAGPVRTYFAQRTEMRQLEATERELRAQIAELEEKKRRLSDPAYITAQARERLGFVMPGDIPYQVQLPPTADIPAPEPGPHEALAPSDEPWYTALWRTIADEPHGVSAPIGGPDDPGAPPPGEPLPPPEPGPEPPPVPEEVPGG